MNRILHWLFGCASFWAYSPGKTKRACRCCGRRQYLRFESRSAGASYEDHTYPLDADPALDPSPVEAFGKTMTLGDIHTLDQLFSPQDRT